MHGCEGEFLFIIADARISADTDVVVELIKFHRPRLHSSDLEENLPCPIRVRVGAWTQVPRRD